MADPISRTIRKNKVALKVNLRELLGEAVPDNPELRQAVGQAILDKIIKRTEAGLDVKGKPFAAYSPDYVKSTAFKAFDKSKSERNMTLTGDMLGLMDIVAESRNTLTIGWNDSDQDPKAFNHITGDTVKKRDFFGLTKEDLADLRKEFAPKVKNGEDEG